MNKVILKGNLTRSVELKTLDSGTDVANFGLATSERYKDKQSGEPKEIVTFVDVSAFGKIAEVLQKHVKKGDPILIEGRLKFDSWEKDGEKRSKLSVRLDNFEFLNRAPAKDAAAPSNSESLDEEPAF